MEQKTFNRFRSFKALSGECKYPLIVIFTMFHLSPTPTQFQFTKFGITEILIYQQHVIKTNFNKHIKHIHDTLPHSQITPNLLSDTFYRICLLPDSIDISKENATQTSSRHAWFWIYFQWAKQQYILIQ